MLELSQVILGVRNLDAATRRMEALGLTVLDGGVHPGVGTANRVVPLGRQYLELLGVVDEAEARAGWYGRALLEAIAGGDRFVRWSLRTDHIDEIAARLGLSPEARQRVRPDGVRLTWKAAGLALAAELGWLPFFMQWDDPAQYPGIQPVRHANGANGVAWIEIATPEPDRLARWTDGADVTLRLAPGEPGLRRVALAIDAGEVVIG